MSEPGPEPVEGWVTVGERLARLVEVVPKVALVRVGAWHWLGIRYGLTKEDVFPLEAIARIDYEVIQECNPDGYGRVIWYHFGRDVKGQEWRDIGGCGPCLRRKILCKSD